MLLAAAGWTIGEWLRSHVLTGFPWNLVGYVWADHPAVMQMASVIGSHGLDLVTLLAAAGFALALRPGASRRARSEEHTSELQSLMRISYAVFCLKKKNTILQENGYSIDNQI